MFEYMYIMHVKVRQNRLASIIIFTHVETNTNMQMFMSMITMQIWRSMICKFEGQ